MPHVRLNQFIGICEQFIDYEIALYFVQYHLILLASFYNAFDLNRNSQIYHKVNEIYTISYPITAHIKHFC